MTRDEIIELAREAWGDTDPSVDSAVWCQNLERFAHLIEQRLQAGDHSQDSHQPGADSHQPQPKQEPVKFLANGTRFKFAFFDEEPDGCGNAGTYVTCFQGYEKELDGRWVALVPAEDNCHLELATPQQREWVGLNEDDIDELEDDRSLETTVDFIQAIEAKLREKNGGRA